MNDLRFASILNYLFWSCTRVQLSVKIMYLETRDPLWMKLFKREWIKFNYSNFKYQQTWSFIFGRGKLRFSFVRVNRRGLIIKKVFIITEVNLINLFTIINAIIIKVVLCICKGMVYPILYFLAYRSCKKIIVSGYCAHKFLTAYQEKINSCNHTV